MCLQLCHVTTMLIDNDLPCAHCPAEVQFAHSAQSCTACAHYCAAPAQLNQETPTPPVYGFGARPVGPQCALTRMPLPRARTCCHWNVTRTVGPTLRLTIEDVAPGLLRYHGVQRVAALFDRSDTAPEYQADGDAVVVAVAELAVPFVYGVPATAWDAALEGSA